MSMPTPIWRIRGQISACGDFGASLLRDVRYAVTAPVGMRYVMSGLENLHANPPGPVLCTILPSP